MARSRCTPRVRCAVWASTGLASRFRQETRQRPEKTNRQRRRLPAPSAAPTMGTVGDFVSPLTPRIIEEARPVAEPSRIPVWETSYHVGETPRNGAVSYRRGNACGSRRARVALTATHINRCRVGVNVALDQTARFELLAHAIRRASNAHDWSQMAGGRRKQAESVGKRSVVPDLFAVWPSRD